MKRLLSIFVLLLCCVGNALAGIDYIGQALDLSQLANGTSTEVVIRAAGNDASDVSYGFVYKSSNRFVIDTNTKNKASLAAKGNEYTFTLIKTADGYYRLQEHLTNNYLPGFITGSGGFSSSNNTPTFRADEYVNASNTLDNAHCYSLTYTADGGFTILKGGNEFQVNNGKPTLYLQFFKYENLLEDYEHFPALYSDEALLRARSAVLSIVSEDQKDAIVATAIETLKASANGRNITISSTGRGGAEHPHYIYRRAEQVTQGGRGSSFFGTGTYDVAALASVFAVEYVAGQGYKLRNVSFGEYLGKTRENNYLILEATEAEAGIYVFEYAGADNACSIKCLNKLGENSYIHEQEQGTYLVSWTAYSVSTPNSNTASRWIIERPQTTVNYRYVSSDGQTEYLTQPVMGYCGESYPAPNVPYGVTAETPDGTFTLSNEIRTIDIPCTINTAFRFAKNFESIKAWYTMAISGDKYLFNYNENDTQMSLTDRTGTDDKYMFAFVGNPFTGYKIYNKAAGSNMILSAPIPNASNWTGGNDYIIMRSTPVDSDYNEYWDVKVSTANASGFFMARHGETVYANKRTYLAFWTGGQDGGSTIYLTEYLVPEKIESEKYYRLFNKKERYYMTEDIADNKLKGASGANIKRPGTDLWQISGDASNGFTLTNAYTGHSIVRQNVWNTQFSAEEGAGFTFTAVEDGDYYVFHYPSSDARSDWSIHGAASKVVLTWTHNNADASRWLINAVEVSEDELEAMHVAYQQYVTDKATVETVNSNRETYNTALAKYFDDYACSQLKTTYAEQSDEVLRSAMEADGLNADIQQMALHVKHNTWVTDKDATYNKYVHDFRIADYEPYSDRHVWKNITKVGAFGQLVNPTGITVKAGDILYIYVGDDVKDSDAQLRLEVAEGTAATGTQSQDLHKGINTYHATVSGSVFVFYNVTNPDKYVYAAKGHEADYPNIRIHIEGGEATGMWDAHRGMKDSDWDYLCQNMLQDEFVHIKGHNTVINCYTEKARGAQRLTDVMKIWDYIFMTEERLIGHDGQWDGRYKPVMTARDQISGNPNWSGTCINLNDINKNGELNFESLMNERWVIYHEEAHGHQYPVNLVGTTESSNNGFAQMVNHEFGLSSRRDDGVKTLVRFKNNGWGWVDMLRGGEGASSKAGFADHGACVWVLNHMFYQLYLYFHVAGNMPDFWPRLCDKMREYGGLVQHGNDPNNPTLYYEDYLLFAQACAETSKTDLSEFFDTWGFFDYYEDVTVGNEYEAFSSKDNAEQGIRFVGDYGHYYLKMPMKTNQEDVNRIEELKTFMKSQPKEAPNIMFIDDHILPRTVSPDCFAAQLDPSRIGQDVAYYNGTSKQGDFGDYAQFTGTNEANALDYSIEGTTVTMTGDGLVGVKIYDGEGNLKYIYNTETFTVPAEVATALANGTMTLVAALGNDTNLPLAKPSAQKHKMIVYNGSADDTQTYFVTGQAAPANIPYSTLTGLTDVPVLSGNAMALLPEESNATYFTLPSAIKGINVFVNNGTAESPYWSAFGVTLTDKQDFYLPEGDYSVGVLTYSRANTAGLNSVCLPFATVPSNYGSGAKAYVFESLSDNIITFAEVQEIPAGAFAIVDCGYNGDAWQLGGSELTLIGSPITDGPSVGSFQNAKIGAGKFKLANTGDEFGVTTENGKVTAFRGYINAPNGSSNILSLTFAEADGVKSIATPEISTPIYDLSGRRASGSTAGGGTLKLERGKTYIINGRKCIIR